LSLFGLVALTIAMTAALVGRLRVAQRLVEAHGGLPDPMLPPPGTRIGQFQVPLAGGRPGEISDTALRGGSTVVGFFAPDCLLCEQVFEQLEAEPRGVAIVALISTAPDTPAATIERLIRRVSSLGPVACLDAQVKAAFGYGDDSGFPTLFKIRRGVIVAAGHRVAELALSPGG
jgi:hypothetical protein